MRCGGVGGRASEQTNLRQEKLVPETPVKSEISRSITKQEPFSLPPADKSRYGPLASNLALRTSRQSSATALASA